MARCLGKSPAWKSHLLDYSARWLQLAVVGQHQMWHHCGVQRNHTTWVILWAMVLNNQRDTKLFQFRMKLICPILKSPMFNVKLCWYSRVRNGFPCFFHRTNLSISLLYICSFNSNSSKEPMLPWGVTPKHNLLHV